MDLMNALAAAGGVDAISRELGVDPSTAQSGINALLPAVVDGMRGQAAGNPQGFGGLGSILAGLGGGGLLSNVLAPEPTNVDQGNQVLGQIFGNKDTSRAVAADAAQKSGISPDLLKKMLPIVAMLVAGYLAKQHSQAAPVPAGADAPPQQDDGILGQILGGAGGGGGAGGILGSILGGLARR
jgi:hypothetical protein